ncbi:hypothetical protein HK102_010957 [Quaeritorhiza haematococci]|nr:hypothetical protein HK102_010957 [Quaeritorhiza haematococci]
MPKLNILQHKSEKNRERVRRDEEQARLEEESKKAKAQLAVECIQLRKAKAVWMSSGNEVGKEKRWSSQGKGGTNAEYEEEKRLEKEKWEKKYTSYLGGDAGKSTPWYANLPSKEPTEEATDKRKQSKSQKVKEREDPLTLMSEYLNHQKKEVKKRRKMLALPSTESGDDKMRRLREERLRREHEERLRAAKLLGKPTSVAPVDIQRHQKDEGYYHSQFNPDFVRKPSSKEDQRESTTHGERGSRRYRPY